MSFERESHTSFSSGLFSIHITDFSTSERAGGSLRQGELRDVQTPAKRDSVPASPGHGRSRIPEPSYASPGAPGSGLQESALDGRVRTREREHRNAGLLSFPCCKRLANVSVVRVSGLDSWLIPAASSFRESQCAAVKLYLSRE